MRRQPIGNSVAGRAVSIAAAVISVFAFAAGCGGSPPRFPPCQRRFRRRPWPPSIPRRGRCTSSCERSPIPWCADENVGQLVLTDGNGQPVDGITVEVLPWMPSHGHGTSQAVEITDQGGGVFIANPLYLFMAGEWQIQMKFRGSR